MEQGRAKTKQSGEEKERKRLKLPSLQLHMGCSVKQTSPPRGTSMKVSMLPLNSLWLYMERGLGFRIFCGLGGRVGGLVVTDKGNKNTSLWNYWTKRE